jgi:hypothetical protein
LRQIVATDHGRPTCLASIRRILHMDCLNRSVSSSAPNSDRGGCGSSPHPRPEAGCRLARLQCWADVTRMLASSRSSAEPRAGPHRSVTRGRNQSESPRTIMRATPHTAASRKNARRDMAARCAVLDLELRCRGRRRFTPTYTAGKPSTIEEPSSIPTANVQRQKFFEPKRSELLSRNTTHGQPRNYGRHRDHLSTRISQFRTILLWGPQA